MLSQTRFAWPVFAVFLYPAAGCQQNNTRASLDRPAAEVEIVEQYWRHGTLKLRKEVVRAADGTMVDHGTYKRWHTNARKEYQATFIHGKEHGVSTHWHKNGQKWTEQHYDHGVRHGPRISWDQNGRKRKEEHYFKGKPDGTWTIWDAAGRIKWQGHFDKGVPLP